MGNLLRNCGLIFFFICVFFNMAGCLPKSEDEVSDAQMSRRDAENSQVNKLTSEPKKKSRIITPSIVTPVSMTNIFRTDLAEHPYTKRQCKSIPSSMSLCRGVPYAKMLVPNLLGHGRARELIRKSNEWTPLLPSNCHPQLQQFLCSLYAPVCIKDQPGVFPPCRSLCEAVRDSCSPTMSKFGYIWPEMLNCDNFPTKNERNSMCMGIEEQRTPEIRTCAPCRKKISRSSLRKKLCEFDFVMKMRVRHLAYGDGSFKINVDKKARIIFKWFDQISPSFNPVKDNRRITLHMRHTTNCTCDVVDTNRTPYLVTGWKQGDKLMIHYITRWQKKTGRVVKALRKKRCMKTYQRRNRNAETF